jgi:putative transposase
MHRSLLRQGIAVRYRFIAAEKANYPVKRLCQLLQVSRSGFYAWCQRAPSARARANAALLTQIRRIHRQSREVYGSPRVHAELRAQGQTCGRHRVARLMREAALRARSRRRFRPARAGAHSLPVAPNRLDRQFEVEAPNTVWVADITALWTDEGWLYLAAVLDLFGRRLVGYSMRATMTRALVCDALKSAIGQRQPPPGLLHHSDQGSQYASADYQALLAKHQMVASMSRRGNCWDNAVMESFFHSLKTERAYHQRYRTRAEARADVFDYIETFYNRRRRHSSLNYLSPAEFEALAQAA